MSLLDIRDDPNYVNANAATKKAIFEQYSADDQDYQGANEATKNAIRTEFGIAATTPPPATPASLTPGQVDAGDAAILATPALAALVPSAAKLPGAVGSAVQTGKALATPAASAAFNLGKTYVTRPGALVTDLAMSAMGLPPPVAAEQSLKGVQGTMGAVRDLATGQGQFAPKAPVAGPVAPTAPFAAAAEAPSAAQIARNPALSEMAARTATTAAPAESSLVQRGMDMASKMRQIAADRVIQPVTQAAERMAPGATRALGQGAELLGKGARVLGSAPVMAAQLMTYSPDLGPAVPQSGPYRGMEINPNTGRPWTAQELAQINGR